MFLEISFWHLVVNQFAETTWLEWVGTLSGFGCVYLAAKENIWNWPVAIISVLAYAILFYEYKLYGDAILQLYFLGTSIYGWYYWLQKKEETHRPVVSLSGKAFVGVISIGLLLSFILGLFLSRFTDSNVPFADGFCTAFSFVAQFLMTRKVLQNWILWIMVDICYVPLYIYKHLDLTALLYLLFLGLAVMGYLQWRKTYKLSPEI